MGEIVDLSQRFLRRGSQVTPFQLQPATVTTLEADTYYGPKPQAEPLEDEADREQLIEAAVQALFDHFDVLSMAEYSPVTKEERAELIGFKEYALSLLTEDEQAVATARFEQTLQSDK